MSSSKVSTTQPSTDAERVAAVRAAIPAGGLFSGPDQLLSPRPLAISKRAARELETLGHQLSTFVRAADTLYRQSAKGSAPGWLAGYLDAGKPAAQVEMGRHPALRDALPKLIAPELLCTEDGFAITELDSRRGGMARAAWLNHTYAEFAPGVLGGAEGMFAGFSAILPNGADIVLGAASIEPRPQMEWFAAALDERQPSGGKFEVADAASYAPRGRDVYRLFDCCESGSIPASSDLAAAAAAGEIELTAPCKPYLDERLWNALFWSRPLRGLWAAQMRAAHIKRLESLIPYSWIIDPAPVPPHAELPKLGVTSWRQLAGWPRNQRALALKLSGFPEQTRGEGGVLKGEELSDDAWAAALRAAVADFPQRPWVLQRCVQAKVFPHPFWDEATGEVREISVWARLQPYYFASGTSSAKPEVKLGGVLATLVPADGQTAAGAAGEICVPCVAE